MRDSHCMNGWKNNIRCSAALIRRPMAAQCGTAAFLFGAGDIIAQQAIEKKGRSHDASLKSDLSV